MSLTDIIIDDGLPAIVFSDPRQIVATALAAYRPASRINVADYAQSHRYLNNRGGGFVGRWSHDEAPYLNGPMAALTDRRYLTTAIVGPARSGKTTVGQNWLLQSVAVDPADFLVVAQTDDMIESYVKREIEPMIDLHPEMRNRSGKRVKDRSLHFKRFEGMFAEFVSASYSNLINKSVARGIVTELDACPIHEGGDAYTLIDIRRQTFGNESMVLVESHPDLAQGIDASRWTAGIMKIYGDSNRQTWWWPCPECNGYSSPTPGTTRSMTLHYDDDAELDEIASSARLLCPCCGYLIEDNMRRAMNVDGKWVAAGQTISEEGEVTGSPISSNTAGFWITGLMSPFVIGGIGALARDYVKAKRHFEATGDDSDLRAATVKRLGIPYQSPNSARNIDAEVIAARADPALKLGEVPDGVRFLTAAVDVQANRFEMIVRGWGVGAESWIIDRRIVMADTAQSAEAWAEMVSFVTETVYPLATDRTRGMKILAAGYDSGGSEGVTLQAYGAWRNARFSRVAKNFGKADGRDLWSLLPLKGASSMNAPLLSVRYPDSQRRDRFARSDGAVPVGFFEPNRIKDMLATQLTIVEPGPNCIHFPKALVDDTTHNFFEQLAAEERSPSGRWKKRKEQSPNEALDLMVMSEVMATLFGVRRINWESPPLWARQLEENLAVVPMENSAQTSQASQHVTGIEAHPKVKIPKTDLRWLTEIARKHGTTKRATYGGW